MDKTLLIFNRYADKGKYQHSVKEIMQELQKFCIAVDAVESGYQGHAIQLAEQGVKEGYTKVLAAGGDGSVNEIVNGLVLAQKKGLGSAALGIIPNGRGNDFGYAMDIPRDLEKSVRLIKDDNRLLMDVGSIKTAVMERYFCNGAGIGLDAAINYYASKSRLTGFSSYAFSLVRAIIKDFRQEMAEISAHDVNMEIPIVFLIVMNGKRLGGGFQLAPDFDIQDGLLDVCVVGKGSPLSRLLPLIPRVFSGDLDHPEIITFKSPWVRVRIQGRGFHGHADGENLFDAGTEFNAQIVPEKIELITHYQRKS